jgi:hypothetical protein
VTRWLLAGLLTLGCADATSGKGEGDATPRQCVGAGCDPECRLNRDCPIGEQCIDGVCLPPERPAPEADAAPSACSRNGDCPESYGCDRETRTCVLETEPSRGCDDARDCFDDERCESFRCVPDVPDAMSRDAEALDAALPDVAVPDTALPDDAMPDVAVPDAAVVDAAVPDAALPDATEPDAALPDAALPDAARPDAAVPDAALPDAAVPDAALPDAALPDAEVPPGPPPTPPRGVYVYDRLPIGGLSEIAVVAFHPDASYALLLERTNVLHVLDWSTGLTTRFDLQPRGADLYWEDLAFDPDGTQAYLVGTRRVRNPASTDGVVYRFDDALFRGGDPAPVAETAVAAGNEFGAIAWPHSAEGHPVVLGRAGPQFQSAVLRELDPDSGLFAGLVTTEFAGAGCQDVVFAEDEFGGQGLLVACGINGGQMLFYATIGGVGEWRRGPGGGQTGNVSRMAAYPGGRYALVIGWSGRRVMRWEQAVMTTGANAPWLQTHDIFGVDFQEDGQRALIYGGTRGNPRGAIIVEYRHDLYDCPAPFNDCDFTDVSIPNIAAPPFAAPDNFRINDAAFRPRCDGGLVVGGRTDFNGSTGQVITFQVQGQGIRDCQAP